MLVDLKLHASLAGLVYLNEASLNPPLMSPHRHVELEFNLVLQGTITYLVAGHRHTFGQGTLLWLFPNQEHQLIDRSPDARHYVAVFKPPLIKAAGCQAEYASRSSSDLPGTRVFSNLVDPRAFDLLVRIMETLLPGGASARILNRELGFGIDSDFRYTHSDPAVLNSGLLYLLAVGWRESQGLMENAPTAPLHPAVRRALAALAEPSTDQSLEEVARRCGVSAAHLSRLFHRQVGVPLNRYRNSARLTRFFTLYRHAEGTKTLLAAALESGFGSYAQFHKIFAEHYGHGPGHYLRHEKSPA